MSNVGSVGSTSRTVATTTETTSQITAQPKAAEESAPALPAVQQDPKVKAGEAKFDGQIREAQVRAQFDKSAPQWKMPGVEVSGPPIDDPKLEKEFKHFDKPMPAVDMNWPEKGDFKEIAVKDGAVQREMVDANGTKFRETITKEGIKQREVEDKHGNRKFEATHPDGYIMRGGAKLEIFICIAEVPIDHMDIDFLPQGHPGFDSPHFDLHFYLVSHTKHAAFRCF